MTLLDTISRKKRITRAILIVLLVILVVMGVYGVYYKHDMLFLFLGIVHLFFAVDYLKSYSRAYATVTFLDGSMTLERKEAALTIDYESVEALTERRNGFLEISRKEGAPVFVHNEVPTGAKAEDPRRTTNILKNEIEARTKRSISVTYRDR